MKLAIMQPYFVPYIGYWQLMNAVDQYVVYDDVNYIKQGWINRNRILIDGQSKYFNIPMIGASSNKLINEIEVNNDDRFVNKNLRRLENAYNKAPYYNVVMPFLENILKCGERNIASYIVKSFEVICEYLGITTEIFFSSDLDKDCNLKGKDKVLSICRLLKATEYYNVIAGKELYSFREFRDHGIALKFLKPGDVVYKQFENEFQKDLSIIDVMMFNSKIRIGEYLNNYEVVAEEDL